MHKWTSAIEGIESVAVKEWSEVLTGLTGEQIKTGFDTWTSDWPPTAHEFRQACIGSVKNGLGLDYVPEYYRDQPIAIGHGTIATKQTAQEKIAEIKKMIRG